jgi:hypothetical protein
MAVAGAKVRANDLVIGDDVLRAALGYLLAMVEHDNVPSDGHDRAHHMLYDHDRQAALRQFSD